MRRSRPATLPHPHLHPLRPPTPLCSYLQGLFALAHDTAPSVRREVCVGLVQLLSIQPDKLQPFIYQVIEYMLASNEHDDEGVALESCEFWMGFCDAELEPELLRKFLPRLIPMLMKNMVGEGCGSPGLGP